MGYELWKVTSQDDEGRVLQCEFAGFVNDLKEAQREAERQGAGRYVMADETGPVFFFDYLPEPERISSFHFHHKPAQVAL